MGNEGESEVAVPVKNLTGAAKIAFFITDGTDPSSEKMQIFSSILATEADLGKDKN
jgi:hypothetical protein